MKRYKIMQKITAMVTLLTMLAGMSVFVSAQEEEYINVSSTVNGKGITVEDISFNCGRAVVSGECDGRYNELITYVVYNADNKGNILSIGEVRNKQDFTYSISIGLKPEDTLKTLLIEIKPQSMTEKASAVFTMNSPEVEFESVLKRTEQLLVSCEEKDIAVDYERVKYQSALKIKDMFKTYAAYGETEAYEYNLEKAISLCNEAQAELNDYLAGKALPKKVVRTITDTVKVNGKSFIADTVSSDGQIEERPVFYVGYGHWNADDIETYRDMGVNLVHYETGPERILKKASDEEIAQGKLFSVDAEKIEEIKQVFKKAEENGISVVFLTAMHYFPEFLYEYDPTIINGAKVSDFPNFTPYNPTHPLVLETFNQFLDAVVPVIKDYKSLNSICLSNEPIFMVNKTPDYYIKEYQRQLKEKYIDINSLNKAHGTSYGDFTQITMPEETAEGSSGRDSLTAFNDYRLFNESIVTAYQKAVRDKVKSIDENIIVHTKGMAYLQSKGRSNNRLELGYNHEEISKFVDINGCDSWAYYGQETDTLQGKTMWYDYMTSVKDAPVFNSEDHILKGGEMSRSDKELDYNMADVWQGAVHGRGATAIWLYDDGKKSNIGSSYYNTNLTRRVDYIAGIGNVALDLNRLSAEVTAIGKEKARVGILYSDSSLVLNPYSLQATYKVYEKAMAYGEKVFFVNETNPEALNEQNLELLIVPCCNYIKKETLSEINEFLDNGGRVLLLNANSKGYYDENGKSHDKTLLNSVTSRSESTSFYKGNGTTIHDNWNTVSNKLKSIFSEFSHPIKLTSANGTTEWLSAVSNGDCIINLCNYGESNTKITLTTALGYNISGAVDLISGEVVGNTFTAYPHKPMLIKIEGEKDFAFYNVNDNGTKTETSQIIGTKMSVKASYNAKYADYAHITAIYENDVLKQIFINRGSADSNGVIKSEKSFEIDSKIDLSKCCVKTFLLNGTDKLVPYMPSEKIIGREVIK